MAELTEDDFLTALEEQQPLAEGVELEEVPEQPVPQQAQEQEEAPAFTQWEDYKNDPRFVDLSPAQKQNLFDDWQNYATQYLAQSGALSTEDDVKYTEDYFTNIAKTDNLRKPIFNAPNYVMQLAQQAQSGFGAMEAGTAGYASALGMTDTATASDVISQKYREQRDRYVNPDLKKFTEEQLGFFGTTGRILTNPFDIAGPLFLQSMGASAPALVAGALAGAAGTAVGGPAVGIGAGLATSSVGSGYVEAVVNFNQMVIEEVVKRGLDPANAKDVQTVLDDPKFVSDAVAYSNTRGVVIGAAELATLGAGKYVGTAIRGAKAAETGAKVAKISGPKKLAIAGAVGGVETVGEGVGETAAQIAAPLVTGKPIEIQPGEIAAEMFVQTPGNIVQGGLQTARVLLDANAPSSASEVTREAVQAAAEGKFEKVLGVQAQAPTDAQKYYDGLSIAEKARVLGMAPNAVLTVEQGTFSSLTEEEKGKVQVDFDTETKAQQGPTVEEAEAKAREAFQPTEPAPAVVAEQPAPVAETPVPAEQAPVAAVVQAPSPTPLEIVQAKPIAEQETAPLEQVAPATAQVVAQEEVQAPAPVAETPAPVAEAPAPTAAKPEVEAPVAVSATAPQAVTPPAAPTPVAETPAPAPVTPAPKKLPPTKKQVTALTKLGYLPADIEGLDRTQAKDIVTKQTPKTPTVEAPKEKAPEVATGAPAPEAPAVPPAPVSEPAAPKEEERAAGEVSTPVVPPAGQPTAPQTEQERLSEAEQKLQAKVGQVIAEADKLGIDEESVKAWLGPTPSDEKILRARVVLRLLNLGLADVYNNIRKIAAKTRGRQAEITEEGGPKIKRVVFTTREEGAGLLSNPEDMNALDVIYVNPDRLLSRLRADVTTDAADFFVKVLEEELLHVQHGRAAFDLFAGTVPEDQVTPENFKNFFRKQSEEIEDSLTLGQIQEVVGKYAGIDTAGKTKEQLIQEFAQVSGRRGRLAEEYLRTLIQRRMLGDITEDKVRGLTPNSVLRSLGMIKNWLQKFIGETVPKKYANQTPVERYYNAVSDLINGNSPAKIREARDEQGTAISGKETLTASFDPMAVRRRFEQTTYQKELVKKINEDFGLGQPRGARKGPLWAKTVGKLIGQFPTFKPDEVEAIVGEEIPNAVKFFDPSQKAVFSTYLYQRAYRSLLDARGKQRRTGIYEAGRVDVPGSVERARFQPLSEQIKKVEKPKDVSPEVNADEIATELEAQENAAEDATKAIVDREAEKFGDATYVLEEKYDRVPTPELAEEDQTFEELRGPKSTTGELVAPGLSPSQAAARTDLSKVFDQIFKSFNEQEQDVFDFLFRANEMENPPTRQGIMAKYNLGHSRQYDRIVESVREKVANTLAENNIFSAGQLSASIDPVFYSKINRTVEESKQGRASGAQWKAMIKNSKLGVSLGEMGLVGVNALEDDKVYTKDEILSYLNANSIEAGEVAFIGDNTPFSDYQIDNFGEDYTEFFVTQKDKKNPEKDLLIETYQKEARAAEERGESQQVLDKLILDLNVTLYEKGLNTVPDWRDGHPQYSGVKNPIVRIRSSVRTLPDGRRMLFLEEVQPPNEENQGLMPPLLMKNWRPIGMKWAIREATDRGLDLIGWTPGKIQVQRYSIAKQIKEIDITAPVSRNERYVDLKGPDGVTFSLTVDPKGLVTESSENASQAKGQLLKDVIGEQLAKQVLKSNTGTIDGQNLEVGGDGLKKLYDEDLRNVVNGLPVVKKSGVRVGQSTLKIDKSLVNEFLRTPEYKELLNQQRIEVKAVEKKRNDNLRYLDQYFKETPVNERTQAYMDGWNVEYDRTVSEFRREMDELDAGFREASNELFATFSQGKKDEGIDLAVPSLELTPEIKASVVKGQPLISASIDPVATQALRRSLLNVPETIANLLKARTYFPYENKELLQKANDFVDANAGENDIFQAKIALDRATETEVSNPQRIITLSVIGKRLKDALYALDQKIKKEGNTPELEALRNKYSTDLYDVLSVAQDILSSSGQDLQAGRVFANLFTPEQMVRVYTKPIADAQKKLLAANAEIQKLKALIQQLKNELAAKAVGKVVIIKAPEPESKFYDFLGLFGDLEPNEQESFQEYLTRIGIDYPALMAELETTITASVDPVTKNSPLPKNFRNLNAREAIKQLVGLDKNFFSKLVNLRVKTGAVATTAEVATAQTNKGRSQVSRKSRPIELQMVFDFFNTTEAEKPTSEEPIEKDSLPLMVRLAKYASDSVTDRVLKSLGVDKKTTPKGLFDEMEKQVRKYVNAQFREEMDPQKTSVEDTRTPEQKLTDLVERIGLAEQIFNQTKANLQARLDEDTRLRAAKVEGQMSDADRAALQVAVNRTFDAGKIVATAKEVRQLVDFKAEARKHISQRGATVGSLSRLIKEKLPNLNDAQVKALADLITANYNRLVKDSGASQLNNILKRSLTKASKQPKKEIDQMLELMNLGAFNEEKFYNAIADRFGLPTWDPEVVAEIKKRGEAVERLPQGSDQRTVASLQLQGFIAQKLKEQAKGYAKLGYVLDVMGSVWKAGVLSGFGTQSVNLVSTGGNVGLELLTSAIGYATTLAVDNKTTFNPGKFIYDVISTYIDNLGRVAPQEAMDAFATGFGRLRSENQKQLTPLEAFSVDTKLPKGAKATAKWTLNNYLGLWKLVGRAMAAADTFNANIAHEAKLRMQMRFLLMSEKGMTSQQADEIMKDLFSADSDMMTGIREQVDREAEAGQFGTLEGIDPKSLAYRVQNRKIEAGKRRRLAQLREQQIAAEVAGDNADETVQGIKRFTEVATFNNNPTGLLGYIGDSIAKLGAGFPLLQPFTSFTRTVANVVNASINYTPYGFFRLAGGSLGNLRKNRGGKYEFERPEGAEFYKLATQATLGTLTLYALNSLFWQDMDEPWDKAKFAVTGLGPSDPNKRAQLRASGWAENSVKVTTPLGPLQFRHSDMPGLSLVLGGLGMLSDSYRYGSLKEADKTTLAAYMAASMGSVVFEKNLLSGAKSFFDILKLREDPVAALQRGAGQYVGGITNPGAFRWLAQTVGVNERGMVEKINYRKLNSTVPGFLLGLTPVAIKVGSPNLNRLGEPVEEYPWTASTKRIGLFPEVKPHPVLSPLVGADLFVPGISRLTKIKVYRKGRPEQVRVDITEDTYYDYAKYNGQYLRRVLTPARAKTLANRAKTDREGAQEELQDLARKAKKYAVDRIEAQIRTKGLGQ